MNEYAIAVHRAPYRRIEIGSAVGVDKRLDITEALSGVGPTERDRIWKLVEQASQGGIGAPSPAAKPTEDLGAIVVPDDVAEAVRALFEEHLPSCGGRLGDEAVFLTRAEALKLMGEDTE
jgi:hypothetical protein